MALGLSSFFLSSVISSRREGSVEIRMCLSRIQSFYVIRTIDIVNGIRDGTKPRVALVPFPGVVIVGDDVAVDAF